MFYPPLLQVMTVGNAGVNSRPQLTSLPPSSMLMLTSPMPNQPVLPNHSVQPTTLTAPTSTTTMNNNTTITGVVATPPSQALPAQAMSQFPQLVPTWYGQMPNLYYSSYPQYFQMQPSQATHQMTSQFIPQQQSQQQQQHLFPQQNLNFQSQLMPATQLSQQQNVPQAYCYQQQLQPQSMQGSLQQGQIGQQYMYPQATLNGCVYPYEDTIKQGNIGSYFSQQQVKEEGTAGVVKFEEMDESKLTLNRNADENKAPKRTAADYAAAKKIEYEAEEAAIGIVEEVQQQQSQQQQQQKQPNEEEEGASSRQISLLMNSGKSMSTQKQHGSRRNLVTESCQTRSKRTKQAEIIKSECPEANEQRVGTAHKPEDDPISRCRTISAFSSAAFQNPKESSGMTAPTTLSHIGNAMHSSSLSNSNQELQASADNDESNEEEELLLLVDEDNVNHDSNSRAAAAAVSSATRTSLTGQFKQTASVMESEEAAVPTTTSTKMLLQQHSNDEDSEEFQKFISEMTGEERWLLSRLQHIRIQNCFKNVVKEFIGYVNRQKMSADLCIYAYENEQNLPLNGNILKNLPVKRVECPSEHEKKMFYFKFNKYMRTKKFNSTSIIQLTTSSLYSRILLDFIQNGAKQWIDSSELNSTAENAIVLNYLDCCVRNHLFLRFLDKASFNSLTIA